MEYKLLSIDESGKASYNHPSNLFILSAVIIPENIKNKIDDQLRKIKIKYFGDENIIFHSRDMSRKKGDFKIFENTKIENNFYGDFISIVNNPKINLSFIITDKIKTKKVGWLAKTILQKSYLLLLQNFAVYLETTKSKGKIIVESDPSQDFYLIQAHNSLQSTGIKKAGISNYEYRHLITSLSLVNKENLDSDIQIADALAHVVGIKFKAEALKKKETLSKIDILKIKLIDRKIKNQKSGSYIKHLL